MTTNATLHSILARPSASMRLYSTYTLRKNHRRSMTIHVFKTPAVSQQIAVHALGRRSSSPRNPYHQVRCGHIYNSIFEGCGQWIFRERSRNRLDYIGECFRRFGGQSVVPWELALFLVEEVSALHTFVKSAQRSWDKLYSNDHLIGLGSL